MVEISTEEKIKLAAASEFVLKGLEGARMQDIADKAGINKAMLHYYFRNKQMLFDTILNEKFAKVFSAFTIWFDPDLELESKIIAFVDKEISIISTFPNLPLFVLSEAWKNPDFIAKKFKDMPIEAMRSQFKAMIDKEVTSGNIRNTSMEEILLNIVSLCVYPIVGKPVFQKILGASEQEYNEILEKRKNQIANMMIKDLEIKTKTK